MKSTILLYHHLGLGDTVICNGIIREYCRLYDVVSIFSKNIFYTHVKFMYRDISNLNIISVENDMEAELYIRNVSGENVKYIGFDLLDHSKTSFDRQFYDIADVTFNIKYSGFYVNRDEKRERKFLYDNLKVSGKYIFVHGLDNIESNHFIFKFDIKYTNNIFDYLKLIENAEEVHCVNSCFLNLIDIMKLNKNLHFHRYARKEYNTDFLTPYLQEKWNIIN